MLLLWFSCRTESVLEAHWCESHSDEYQFPDTEDSDTENLEPEDSENEEKNDDYKCKECNSIFKNAGQIRRHKKQAHEAVAYMTQVIRWRMLFIKLVVSYSNMIALNWSFDLSFETFELLLMPFPKST